VHHCIRRVSENLDGQTDIACYLLSVVAVHTARTRLYTAQSSAQSLT